MLRPILDTTGPAAIVLAGKHSPRLRSRIHEYCCERGLTAHIIGSQDANIAQNDRLQYHEHGSPASADLPGADVVLVDGLVGSTGISVGDLGRLERGAIDAYRFPPVIALASHPEVTRPRASSASSNAGNQASLAEKFLERSQLAWSLANLPGSPDLSILAANDMVSARAPLAALVDRFGTLTFLRQRLCLVERARFEAEACAERALEKAGVSAARVAQLEQELAQISHDKGDAEHGLSRTSKRLAALESELPEREAAIAVVQAELSAQRELARAVSETAERADARAEAATRELETTAAHAGELWREVSQLRRAEQRRARDLAIEREDYAAERSDDRRGVAPAGESRSWRWGHRTFSALRTLTFRPPKGPDGIARLRARLEQVDSHQQMYDSVASPSPHPCAKGPLHGHYPDAMDAVKFRVTRFITPAGTRIRANPLLSSIGGCW